MYKQASMEGILDGIEGKEVWLKGAEDGRSDTYQMRYLPDEMPLWKLCLEVERFEQRRLSEKRSAKELVSDLTDRGRTWARHQRVFEFTLCYSATYKCRIAVWQYGKRQSRRERTRAGRNRQL